MKLLRYLLLFALVGAFACATAVEDDDGGVPSGQGGSGSTATTGAGGAATAASSGSGVQCEPPEHLCGGICTGNTVETGCYQSTSCMPCPVVTNGTAKCSPEGLCDADCVAGYQKSGNACICPTQCCGDSDCGSGQKCENGQCVTPCDQLSCALFCILDGYDNGGQCQNNECVCIP